MGLLGVLGLGLVDAARFRDIFLAIAAGDHFARLGDGFRGGLDAVGPHIGDQADGLAADIDALIQFLGRLHGALGVEAQLARGFLLQGRGGEGRGWGAAAGLLLHRGDLECRGLYGQLGGPGGGGVAQVELGQALALVLDQAGQEGIGAGGDVRLHRPIFLGLEPLDLQFAIDHQPQGHGLHPAGRARARQLAPQHRRQGEAHQIVQGATGQIGVDQLHVDGARMLHRLGHGRLGDGVEHHPLHDRALDRLLAVQDFQHVPADGLALAIRVGGQDQAIGPLHGVGDVGQALGGLAVHLPGHGEIVVRQHRTVLRRQVADVPVAGQDDIVRAQILVDGLYLARTLDDDDVHATPWA